MSNEVDTSVPGLAALRKHLHGKWDFKMNTVNTDPATHVMVPRQEYKRLCEVASATCDPPHYLFKQMREFLLGVAEHIRKIEHATPDKLAEFLEAESERLPQALWNQATKP